MRNDKTITANSAAVTTAVVYTLFRLMAAYAPGLLVSVNRALSESAQFTKSGILNLTAPSFFLGLVLSAVSAWVMSYLFAFLSNYLKGR